jgi:hypothetical protein
MCFKEYYTNKNVNVGDISVILHREKYFRVGFI